MKILDGSDSYDVDTEVDIQGQGGSPESLVPTRRWGGQIDGGAKAPRKPEPQQERVIEKVPLLDINHMARIITGFPPYGMHTFREDPESFFHDLLRKERPYELFFGLPTELKGKVVRDLKDSNAWDKFSIEGKAGFNALVLSEEERKRQANGDPHFMQRCERAGCGVITETMVVELHNSDGVCPKYDSCRGVSLKKRGMDVLYENEDGKCPSYDSCSRSKTGVKEVTYGPCPLIENCITSLTLHEEDVANYMSWLNEYLKKGMSERKGLGALIPGLEADTETDWESIMRGAIAEHHYVFDPGSSQFVRARHIIETNGKGERYRFLRSPEPYGDVRGDEFYGDGIGRFLNPNPKITPGLRSIGCM